MTAEVKYELMHLLGKGGFGEVWLAKQKQTQQLVALKIMQLEEGVRGEQSQFKAQERFMREIEIALLLKHPHVLPALDYGYMQVNKHTQPYLVSPYKPEGSLADLLEKKRIYPWEHWTPGQTADAIWQAAQALNYMHTREPKIIHQDVKPGNFLFQWEREKGPDRIVHLFLCDFGISRWQRTAFDVSSQVLGTLGYMAPERVYGNITPSADQFALAAMAYRFLAGKLPVYAHDSASEPFPPSQLNPGRVPFKEIDKVILQGLKSRPQERFPSVLAFGEALCDAAHVAVGPHEEVTQMGPSIVSRPVETSPPPINQELRPIIIDPLKKDEKKAQKKPESVEPTPSWTGGEEKQQLPSESFTRQILSKDLPGLPSMLSWSVDGKYMICTFYNQQAPLLIDIDGNIETLRHLGPARFACWSSGGHILTVSEQRSIQGENQSIVQLWDMRASTKRPLALPLHTSTLDSVDWSREGKLAVWVESQLQLYDIPQRLSTAPQSLVAKTLTLQNMCCGSVGALRWSPDGALLAAGANNGAVICWHVKTQRFLRLAPASGQLVYSLAWSPDSELLAVAFRDKRVEVWDVYKGRLQTRWTHLPLVPRTVSISTKQRLVIASDKEELLFGAIDEVEPSASYPGHWLGVWSPVDGKLATLDAERETGLVIWDR
jgi:serine/threonine protein kinase